MANRGSILLEGALPYETEDFNAGLIRSEREMMVQIKIRLAKRNLIPEIEFINLYKKMFA